MSTNLLIASIILLATAALSASGEQFVAGIDIGRDHEARVRSGIERNRKSPATIEVVNSSGRPVAGANVYVEQTSSDFLFGCAFPAWPAPPPKLGEEGWNRWNRYFTRLFNYATTENSLKWGFSERQQGKPDWSSADFIARWCKERNIILKGHNLVWGLDSHGTPDWVYSHPPSKVGELFEARIREAMSRYKYDIHIWDVVNEPTHLHRLEKAWSQDYVLLSYKWAREVDPKAVLVINEYSCFTGAADSFVAMVNKLLAQGAPIDVIAEQAHDVPTWYNPQQILENLDKLASTGLRVHLTEITYPSNGAAITGGFLKGAWDEQKQAEFYRYLVTLAFSHPNVDAITFWAMWDGSTWHKGGGVIREDWTPKPSYHVLDALINEKWKTKFRATSDANGQVRFHGFHGAYEVSVKAPDGRSKKGAFHLARGKAAALRIVLRPAPL